VRLPCRAYFVTDAKERLSKATGAQCATLAPDQVSLCDPSELPELDPETTVLLLPAEDAMDVATLVRRLEGSGGAKRTGEPRRAVDAADAAVDAPAAPRGENDGAEKRTDGTDGTRLAVVVIDSKWDRASSIGRGERLRDLPRVRLSTYRTSFWRFHPQPKANGKRDEAELRRARGEDDGDDMLCSLEALFFFARELHENGFRGANIKGPARFESARSTERVRRASRRRRAAKEKAATRRATATTTCSGSSRTSTPWWPRARRRARSSTRSRPSRGASVRAEPRAGPSGETRRRRRYSSSVA
jgi:hypothetical protein